MFEAVVGHQRIKTVLERMLAKDRIPHGLCFYGPAGIGKRLTARELAKAMLCAERTGCGACKHCRKFAGGNHPDYQEIHPDGQDIKVGQIREVSENLHFRPFEAKVRVIVLEAVDRMGEAAANAFLKSLEEPPSYVYFILITSDLKALLPTIRSRCQKTAFQSLTVQDKQAILESRFQVQPNMAERLARISIRRLETDVEAWEIFNRNVDVALKFFELMLAEGQAVEYFSNIARDKEQYPTFFDHLIALVRVTALAARGLPVSVEFAEFEARIRALIAKTEPVRWRELMERLLALAGASRRNLNLDIWYNSFSLNGLGLFEKETERLKARLSGR